MNTETKRGGAREGAGRKPNNPGEPMKNRAMRWTDAGWADVMLIGMDRVRELVAKEAKKVRASDSKKQSKTSEKDVDIV
jgi:hypothetical protein